MPEKINNMLMSMKKVKLPDAIKIAIVAGRGGVGKSTWAFNLAKLQDAYLITNDPTSPIDLVYPEYFQYQKKIEVIDNDDYSFIYDFAGHITDEMIAVAKEVDVVIILTDMSNHAISGTSLLLDRLRPHAKDCFVIANRLGFDRTEYSSSKLVVDFNTIKQAFDKFNVDILPFRFSAVAGESLDYGIEMIDKFTTVKDRNKAKKTYIVEYKQLENILKRITNGKFNQVVFNPIKEVQNG